MATTVRTSEMIRGTNLVRKGYLDDGVVVDLNRLAQQSNHPREQYKLHFENHHRIMADEILDCYESLRYWDLKFLVQGNKIIPVHRVVIVSFSPLIKRLLLEFSDSDLIQFPDTNVNDMLIFVRLMYTGYARIQKGKLEALNDLIKLLEIQRCDLFDAPATSFSGTIIQKKKVAPPPKTSSKSLGLLITGIIISTQRENIVENGSSNPYIALSSDSNNESLSGMIVGSYIDIVDTPHEIHKTDIDYMLREPQSDHVKSQNDADRYNKSDETLERMEILIQVPGHRVTFQNVEQTTPSIHNSKSQSQKNHMNEMNHQLTTSAPKRRYRSKSTGPLDLSIQKSGISQIRKILPKSKSQETSNGGRHKYVLMSEHSYTKLNKNSKATPNQLK